MAMHPLPLALLVSLGVVAAQARLAAEVEPGTGGAGSCEEEGEEVELQLLQTHRNVKRGSESHLSLRLASPSYGQAGCPCVGIDWPRAETLDLNLSNATVSYPLSMGSSCQAWDSGRHPDCTGSNPPSWCTRAWCLVDACNCNLSTPPKLSSYLPSETYQGHKIYYSYATCGAEDSWTAENHGSACVNQATQSQCEALSSCAWTNTSGCVGRELSACAREGNETLLGSTACRCIGFSGVAGNVAAKIGGFYYNYPAEVGSYCSAWDGGSHPNCTGSNPPSWCADNWCYVDPCSCDLATVPKKLTYFRGATYQGKPLFYSYSACGVQDNYTATGNVLACTNFNEAACRQQSHCAYSSTQGCMSKDIISMCTNASAPSASSTSSSSTAAPATTTPPPSTTAEARSSNRTAGSNGTNQTQESGAVARLPGVLAVAAVAFLAASA